MKSLSDFYIPLMNLNIFWFLFIWAINIKRIKWLWFKLVTFILIHGYGMHISDTSKTITIGRYYLVDVAACKKNCDVLAEQTSNDLAID